MKPIPTVNVIERVSPGNLVTHSFPETPEGNQAAETLFGHIAKENGLEIPEIERAIENGYAEAYAGPWELYLVHSEV